MGDLDPAEERKARRAAVSLARREAVAKLKRWRKMPQGPLRRAAENEARTALARLAEARRHLEDLRGWSNSPDEIPYRTRPWRG